MKKVVGIEISDYPSECAERMRSEYTSWMKWFGKEHQPFELHHGDFMDDKFRPLIMSATVLFINNYAFNSDLEERIKVAQEQLSFNKVQSEIIHNLNDGTRIVSTKPYARLGREATTDMDLSGISCENVLNRNPRCDVDVGGGRAADRGDACELDPQHRALLSAHS